MNMVIPSVFVLAALTSAATAGSPPNYTAQFITPGLSAINAAAMNEAGDVVGTTDSPTTCGWVSLAGKPATLLPLPPGAQSSSAMNINDLGIIVGAVSPTSSPEFGALPGHVKSNATALNNIGDIVGWSFDGMFRLPVLLTPEGIVNLIDTGIFEPAEIND